MPIYEYTCESCGHELEALQGLNDDLLSECPECGDAALRKRISRVAFRLKGSGWYETDFKDKDQRNVAGDSGGESGSAKESSGGSESGGDGGSSSSGNNGAESKGSGSSSDNATSSGKGDSGSGSSNSSSSGTSGSGKPGKDD